MRRAAGPRRMSVRRVPPIMVATRRTSVGAGRSAVAASGAGSTGGTRHQALAARGHLRNRSFSVELSVSAILAAARWVGGTRDVALPRNRVQKPDCVLN